MAGQGRKPGDGKGRYGGRQKGTPNKDKKNLEMGIAMLLDDKLEEFESMMSLLGPKEYCRIYVDLLRYRLPTKQAVAVKDETEEGRRAAYTILTNLRKGILTDMPKPEGMEDYEDEDEGKEDEE